MCSTCGASAICAVPRCWRGRSWPAASTCCWSRGARLSRALCWAGDAFTSSRRLPPPAEGGGVAEAFQRRRTEALLGLLGAEAPDVVITEQFPFGRTRLRFELLPLLE